MKGFGIYVKNELIDPKHISAMGGSPLWLYLWCLDKMTSISETGIGLVLGGKPIVFEVDIEQEMGVPRRTYARWVNQLRRFGYITTTRTPNGLVIRVNKAAKLWKGYAKSGTSDTSDVPKMAKGYAKSGTSDMPKVAHAIKTKQLDNTVDNTRESAHPKNSSLKILNDPIVIAELRSKFPGVDVDEQLEFAKDWLLAKGKTYKDYVAFARNWLRKPYAQKRYDNRRSIGAGKVVSIK